MKNSKLAVNKTLSKLRGCKNDFKKYGVKKIGIFGSFARGEQTKNSDMDFIVEFQKPDFKSFMNLSGFLERRFKRKVDILTPDGIRSIRIKKVAEEIKRTAIYV